MIVVADKNFNLSTFTSRYPEGSIERQIIESMSKSTEEYHYDHAKTLKFELDLRKEIVFAAIELDRSQFSFAIFEHSRCNDQYWNRTDNGGFKLKDRAKASDAMYDIFVNGEKYATECATAVMIVYYKALLNVFQEDLFNQVFSTIYLMDWDVREPLLKEVMDLKQTTNPLLGDRQYFANPDVNPESPEWQGENVIVLPKGMYYGHGIGIVTGNQIMQELNSKRKSGASRFAYLMDVVGHPNFQKLSDVFENRAIPTGTLVWKPFPEPII